jgi:hypothetical protein
VQRLPDSHTRLELAERLAAHLISDRFTAELSHLSQARILYLRSEREVLLHGHPAAAYICSPRVQGPMSSIVEDLVAGFARDLFDGHDPDFIVRVDAATWDGLAHTEPALEFWRALRQPTPDDCDWSVGRERLICHELLHVYQRKDKDGALRFSEEDGRPVLALRPHDIERFHHELEHYGPTLCDADDAAIAIATGYRQQERRALARRRIA